MSKRHGNHFFFFCSCIKNGHVCIIVWKIHTHFHSVLLHGEYYTLLQLAAIKTLQKKKMTKMMWLKRAAVKFKNMENNVKNMINMWFVLSCIDLGKVTVLLAVHTDLMFSWTATFTCTVRTVCMYLFILWMCFYNALLHIALNEKLLNFFQGNFLFSNCIWNC